MKITNACAALLSNYEVMALLDERQNIQIELQRNDASIEYPENLRTIQFEVTEYLKTSPCSTQTPAQLKDFLDALKPFKLTRAERLQILNLRPKSAVEIYLIIEECEERFSEDDLENMLNIIITTLPRDDDEVEEEEAEEGEEGEPMEQYD
ncbi:HRDC-like protein [Phycomyces blakesleeanus]|uniref:DNA-directed RNA polymerase III subunit RPC9 n=2 Tax=Phycomyces blakesleeanus TaxID=4837 RepID=A0A162PQ32_PHYB8|nr:hypothetical protein PHYBLDRAFT_61028 [Phycomyces blakesleeanus NRRL 1555(-)]OAD74927.1 hypothetical protein PHYBLDRAFT_61028 [Phycomyces blakesleeanus NRRL 1555(-)]|eukprot:XP_018292967.1 hypothetical protein PHYBLDRAFT_61028 [Phycomyces blakesleeanus NRRL 1555(-)]